MNAPAATQAVRRFGRDRLGLAILVALALALVPALIGFARWSINALRFPYGIDYGEGIVWEQLTRLMEGRGYGTITALPAIVYHYPPLYHLVTALVAGVTGIDMLLAGRSVSLACTVATVAIVVAITRRLLPPDRHRIANGICAALAGALFLHFYNVTYWAPLMRVDPLAVLLTTAGLLCGMASLKRPALVHAAAVLFVGAVFTKQTSIVAPAAVFGTLLFVRRPLALRGIATGAGLAIVLLGVAMALTGGRFLTHVVGYNVNRFNWPMLRQNLKIAAWEVDRFAVIFAAVTATLLLVRVARRATWRMDPDRTAGLVMLLAFLALKTATLVTLSKSGASSNYLIDWLAAVAIACGLGLRGCYTLLAGADGRRSIAGAAIGLAAPLLLLAGQFSGKTRPPPVLDVDGERIVETRVERILRSCPGWVIGDNMVAIIRAGKRVVWEPSIFAELTGMGLYDNRPVLTAIASNRICAAVVEDWRFNETAYPPAVLALLDRHFARREHVGRWVVFSGSQPN